MIAPAPVIAIRALDAAEAEARLPDLAAILVDAVAQRASVNFMAGFAAPAATTFWRELLPGLVAGEKRLFVADDGIRLIGTVILAFAPQPNQPHRADIGKMLVHSAMRRRGIGRRLLYAAESAAIQAGRTLLMLDTQTGSAGDHLYRRCGWVCFGEVPGHALTPDGTPAATTFFYKIVGRPAV